MLLFDSCPMEGRPVSLQVCNVTHLCGMQNVKSGMIKQMDWKDVRAWSVKTMYLQLINYLISLWMWNTLLWLLCFHAHINIKTKCDFSIAQMSVIESSYQISKSITNNQTLWQALIKHVVHIMPTDGLNNVTYFHTPALDMG